MNNGLFWSKVQAQFSETFIAFRNYNYRLWFGGQLISLVGTWMQTTAQGYLVYEITHDPAYLGYVAFASGAPTWIFTLYGGLLTDRMPKRILLILTQTAMMVLAFILAALVFLQLIQPWMIIILAFLLGTANAFDAPARLSFVVDMVNREDVPNAIALNSSMFNMATVVGPAVSGLTYAAVGPAWCFLLNGISFIAVIIGLLLMRLKALPPRPRLVGSFSEIKQGLQFVAHHETISIILFNLGLISMFGMGLVSLLPAWSNTVLGGDVTYNGYLLSARGVGSFIAALILAYLSAKQVKGKLLIIGTLILPVSMLIFVFMTWLPLSLLAIVVIGLGFMLATNATNALIQELTTDELRGRVMSIYTLVFFGMAPIGALLLGLVASWTSEPIAVGASSVLLLIVAVWITVRRPNIRTLK